MRWIHVGWERVVPLGLECESQRSDVRGNRIVVYDMHRTFWVEAEGCVEEKYSAHFERIAHLADGAQRVADMLEDVEAGDHIVSRGLERLVLQVKRSDRDSAAL